MSNNNIVQSQNFTFLAAFICMCICGQVIAQDLLGTPFVGDNIGAQMGQGVDFTNDGRRVVLGATSTVTPNGTRGRVKVYEYDGVEWVQVGQDIDGPPEGVAFGAATGISSDGNTIICGVPFLDLNSISGGGAYVYEFNGNQWVQKGDPIQAAESGDAEGAYASINDAGDIVAIGSRFNDDNGPSAGHVRVFRYQNGIWIQQGLPILGVDSNDEAGAAVSLDATGTRIAVGAPFRDPFGGASGHVRVFDFINSQWVQVGDEIVGETPNDNSGDSVSLSNDGTTVAIGSPFNPDGGGFGTGSVRVFRFVNNAWTQLGSDIDGEPDDRLGDAVALNQSGNILLVGSSNYDGDIGRARIYQFLNNEWIPRGVDMVGEADNDSFGRRLAMSEDASVVGISAIENNDETGKVYVYGTSEILSNASFSFPDIQIAPNPTDGVLNIVLQQAHRFLHFELYDIGGRRLMTGTLEDFKDTFSVDLNELVSGIYMLVLRDEERSFSQRIIKK